MHESIRNSHKNILKLGLGVLAHANYHAHLYSDMNNHWPPLAVVQAAHAAELILKARIAQEHPLLVFSTVPKRQTEGKPLTIETLLEHGKSLQYSDLPDRLWAASGITLPRIDLYEKFGRLRNMIQHFQTPDDSKLEFKTLEFIFGVIDPFLVECWGLHAIDYNEDHEPFMFLVEALIRNEIEFTVSPACLADLLASISHESLDPNQKPDSEFFSQLFTDCDDDAYRTRMMEKFMNAIRDPV